VKHKWTLLTLIDLILSVFDECFDKTIPLVTPALLSTFFGDSFFLLKHSIDRLRGWVCNLGDPGGLGDRKALHMDKMDEQQPLLVSN
jgi:hypothetical protein